MNEDEIVRTYDRHSNETVTLKKHVTECQHIRKLMVEFVRKSASRGIKIARANSIGIAKSIFIFNTFFLLPLPLSDVIKRTRFLMSSPVNILYTLVGVPQSGVLPPPLFLLYTAEFCSIYWWTSCKIILTTSFWLMFAIPCERVAIAESRNLDLN